MRMVSSTTPRIPPLFSDLAKILAGDLDCSHETLSKYASDGSPYFILPQAVVFPKNATDIKHILAFAREYKMPVTPRGGGVSGTGAALGEGIILDMSRYFEQIRNINMVENTITVDAGVPVEFLLEKLHAWNVDIPYLTHEHWGSTIGAVIANKSTSSSSFYHGTIREWIEGVTVVVDNGEEHQIADGVTPSGRLLGIYQSVFPLLTKENPTLRASKPHSHDDPTGYNLWSTAIGPRQLIEQLVGSEGTLGIITSITFRVSPYKKFSKTHCIPISEKSYIPVLTEIAKHHQAEHLYLCDRTAINLAERYRPNVIPYFSEGNYILFVTHTGNDKEAVTNIARTFLRSLPHELIAQAPEETESFHTLIRADFLHTLYELYTSASLTPISIADGLIVELHLVPALLSELETYLDSLGNLYTVTGNIGSGHIGITTLFDAQAQTYEQSLLTYAKTIFSIIRNYNGGISARGGEGLSRTPYIPYIYNDATLSVFKKVKDAWDPLSILNPGKKINTTTTYLSQHLKRD